MKKMTWALLSLMLFLGLGTAFAQDDPGFGGGGGGDVTITVPTLKPASGVVKPGATIDGTFSEEMVLQCGPTGALNCICVLYVENDESTTLETTMDELGPFMNLLTAEEGEEVTVPSYDYKIALYAINNDEDYEPEDPEDPAGWMKWYAPITILKGVADENGDVKLRAKVAAITQTYEIKYSEEFTASYNVKPVLSLTPLFTDGKIGKNAPVGFTVDHGLVKQTRSMLTGEWISEPAPAEALYSTTVYYTLGTTEPTKENYEVQTDKENGAIKMLTNTYDGWGFAMNDYGRYLPVVAFGEAGTLKAKAYYTTATPEAPESEESEFSLLTEEGEGDAETEEVEEYETDVYELTFAFKSEETPVIEPAASAKEFYVGDKIIIKNPNSLSAYPEPEWPGDNATQEELDKYWQESGEREDLVDAMPQTKLYVSFDGTTPSAVAFSEQDPGDAWDYSGFSIFETNAYGDDVEITIGYDADGFFVTGDIFGPYAMKKYRLTNIADNKLTVKALAVSVYKEEADGDGNVEEKLYGSEYATAEYTLLTLPATVTKPTFVPDPEAGNVAKGDAVKFEMDAAYDEYPIGQSLVAVAYVIDGTDVDLTIDKARLETLMQEKAAGYTGYRQAGKVYLYEGEADAFPIEKTCAVKACQIVALSYEVESEDPDAEPEVEIVFNLSEIVTANYTVDASKLAKPTIKTPKAGSTVEPNSPITFEMPSDYDWSAYTNLAYILYVENNETVKLEGTADDIIGAVPHTPSTDAKAGEPAYKVVECALMGDDLNWTKALIETESGALTIRARLAGITLNDEVFYSDEVTVSCTVAKGEGPGDDPVNPSLPATVKAPVFVPAAGEVEKGTAITWTWDEEAYNEETYPMVAVAYVVNGSDADLDITDENIGDLWNASQDEDANTVREEGVTYLYRTYDVDDAYPYHIEKASTVKARLIIGVLDETGEPAIALSAIVTAEYTIKGETPATVTLTFDPASGAEVEEGTAVAITASQDVEIFYMMFESEEAAKAAAWNQEEALSYSDELKPVPTKEKNTIKAAYALEGAEAVAEDFFYATYTVKELPAITLTFNPASGSEVEDNTTVTVTANRETEIFYNVYADEAAADADKETFMANAKEVKEDGMPVIKKGNTYLRCAVTDKGEMKYFNATYKIKEVADDVANEGLELSGVSVYPNPSNGLFNLELPVAATVEVFASNGMLMQRFNAAEGNATLNIERSGIYFLRITGEGRTTVKRLIVR